VCLLWFNSCILAAFKHLARREGFTHVFVCCSCRIAALWSERVDERGLVVGSICVSLTARGSHPWVRGCDSCHSDARAQTHNAPSTCCVGEPCARGSGAQSCCARSRESCVPFYGTPLRSRRWWGVPLRDATFSAALFKRIESVNTERRQASKLVRAEMCD
jgi:hypothetical protein